MQYPLHSIVKEVFFFFTQETVPFSASKGDTFSFHTRETCSTQEHELIAQRSRNKANIEMYSTVQSAVFSLHLPTFLKSEH